ncbi:MAG: aldehyde-activating protein [Erythrobacter sp.]|jgi:hypothetical protein|nr:aldehyde-activating protein [Erythrobacter sp.]
MTFECLCGDVTITTRTKPEFAHACNCTLCRKSGARWAYFHPGEVALSGRTTSYRRADKADPSAEIHACARCAVTTHFVLTEAAIAQHGNTMMGLNINLAEPEALRGVELRFPDGRGWDGVGAFEYVEPARSL